MADKSNKFFHFVIGDDSRFKSHLQGAWCGGTVEGLQRSRGKSQRGVSGTALHVLLLQRDGC